MLSRKKEDFSKTIKSKTRKSCHQKGSGFVAKTKRLFKTTKTNKNTRRVYDAAWREYGNYDGDYDPETEQYIQAENELFVLKSTKNLKLGAMMQPLIVDSFLNFFKQAGSILPVYKGKTARKTSWFGGIPKAFEKNRIPRETYQLLFIMSYIQHSMKDISTYKLISIINSLSLIVGPSTKSQIFQKNDNSTTQSTSFQLPIPYLPPHRPHVWNPNDKLWESDVSYDFKTRFSTYPKTGYNDKHIVSEIFKTTRIIPYIIPSTTQIDWKYVTISSGQFRNVIRPVPFSKKKFDDMTFESSEDEEEYEPITSSEIEIEEDRQEYIYDGLVWQSKNAPPSYRYYSRSDHKSKYNNAQFKPFIAVKSMLPFYYVISDLVNCLGFELKSKFTNSATSPKTTYTSDLMVQNAYMLDSANIFLDHTFIEIIFHTNKNIAKIAIKNNSKKERIWWQWSRDTELLKEARGECPRWMREDQAVLFLEKFFKEFILEDDIEKHIIEILRPRGYLSSLEEQFGFQEQEAYVGINHCRLFVIDNINIKYTKRDNKDEFKAYYSFQETIMTEILSLKVRDAIRDYRDLIKYIVDIKLYDMISSIVGIADKTKQKKKQEARVKKISENKLGSTMYLKERFEKYKITYPIHMLGENEIKTPLNKNPHIIPYSDTPSTFKYQVGDSVQLRTITPNPPTGHSTNTLVQINHLDWTSTKMFDGINDDNKVKMIRLYPFYEKHPSYYIICAAMSSMNKIRPADTVFKLDFNRDESTVSLNTTRPTPPPLPDTIYLKFFYFNKESDSNDGISYTLSAISVSSNCMYWEEVASSSSASYKILTKTEVELDVTNAVAPSTSIAVAAAVGKMKRKRRGGAGTGQVASSSEVNNPKYIFSLKSEKDQKTVQITDTDIVAKSKYIRYPVSDLNHNNEPQRIFAIKPPQTQASTVEQKQKKEHNLLTAKQQIRTIFSSESSPTIELATLTTTTTIAPHQTRHVKFDSDIGNSITYNIDTAGFGSVMVTGTPAATQNSTNYIGMESIGGTYPSNLMNHITEYTAPHTPPITSSIPSAPCPVYQSIADNVNDLNSIIIPCTYYDIEYYKYRTGIKQLPLIRSGIIQQPTPHKSETVPFGFEDNILIPPILTVDGEVDDKLFRWIDAFNLSIHEIETQLELQSSVCPYLDVFVYLNQNIKDVVTATNIIWKSHQMTDDNRALSVIDNPRSFWFTKQIDSWAVFRFKRENQNTSGTFCFSSTSSNHTRKNTDKKTTNYDIFVKKTGMLIECTGNDIKTLEYSEEDDNSSSNYWNAKSTTTLTEKTASFIQKLLLQHTQKIILKKNYQPNEAAGVHDIFEINNISLHNDYHLNDLTSPETLSKTTEKQKGFYNQIQYPNTHTTTIPKNVLQRSDSKTDTLNPNSLYFNKVNSLKHATESSPTTYRYHLSNEQYFKFNEKYNEVSHTNQTNTVIALYVNANYKTEDMYRVGYFQIVYPNATSIPSQPPIYVRAATPQPDPTATVDPNTDTHTNTDPAPDNTNANADTDTTPLLGGGGGGGGGGTLPGPIPNTRGHLISLSASQMKAIFKRIYFFPNLRPLRAFEKLVENELLWHFYKSGTDDDKNTENKNREKLLKMFIYEYFNDDSDEKKRNICTRFFIVNNKTDFDNDGLKNVNNGFDTSNDEFKRLLKKKDYTIGSTTSTNAKLDGFLLFKKIYEVINTHFEHYSLSEKYGNQRRRSTAKYIAIYEFELFYFCLMALIDKSLLNSECVKSLQERRTAGTVDSQKDDDIKHKYSTIDITYNCYNIPNQIEVILTKTDDFPSVGWVKLKYRIKRKSTAGERFNPMKKKDQYFEHDFRLSLHAQYCSTHSLNSLLSNFPIIFNPTGIKALKPTDALEADYKISLYDQKMETTMFHEILSKMYDSLFIIGPGLIQFLNERLENFQRILLDPSFINSPNHEKATQVASQILQNELYLLREKLKKCVATSDFDTNDQRVLEFTQSIPRNIYNIESAYTSVKEVSQHEEEQFEDNRYNWRSGVGGNRRRSRSRNRNRKSSLISKKNVLSSNNQILTRRQQRRGRQS